MLAAALLVSLWAQAEQAPVPPAAAPAPAAAAPAPSTAPAAGAPAPVAATPAPPPPAPGSSAAPPVVATPEPALPPNSVSVQVRYAYRVGSDGDSLAPSAGMSLGGEFERRLLGFESGFELGLAFDFFYDRFAKDVIGSAPGPTGQELTITTRALSQTSFALMETTAWRYADMRVFAAIGGGPTIGYFGSPDLGASRTAAKLLVRGALGIDFAVTAKVAAILRIDYNRIFDHETFTASGNTYPLFGDIFDAGIGLLVRF